MAAMITEGVVALIGLRYRPYFFYYGGWKEVVASPGWRATTKPRCNWPMADLIQYFTAPQVVNLKCSGWLGFVAARLRCWVWWPLPSPVATNVPQRPSDRCQCGSISGRRAWPGRPAIVSVPLFAAALLLLIWQMANPNGFNVLWQYFGWFNQALSVFTLWMITVYLARNGKPYIITLIPALLMTVVCGTFMVASPPSPRPWRIHAVGCAGGYRGGCRVVCRMAQELQGRSRPGPEITGASVGTAWSVQMALALLVDTSLIHTDRATGVILTLVAFWIIKNFVLPL